MTDITQLLKDKTKAKRLYRKWEKEYYRLDKEVKNNCPHSDTTESSTYDSGDGGYDRYCPCTHYKSVCNTCGNTVKTWRVDHWNARQHY